MLVSELVDSIGSVSEEEDLIVSDFFGNLDRSTIDGSEEKASVESELQSYNDQSLQRDLGISALPSCYWYPKLQYRQSRCAEKYRKPGLEEKQY